MDARKNSDVFCYMLVVVGVALAVFSSFVPFYTSGYRLSVAILLAGLAPYLVYVIAVPLLRGVLTVMCGVLLIVVHLWLVISERILDNPNYDDGMIYYVPIVMAVMMAPLAVAAVRLPWIINANKLQDQITDPVE